METIGTGAGQLNLRFQIGSAWYKYVSFRRYDATTDTYTNEDISTKTFSFFLKKFKGDRIKVLNLTNGNGISVPVYSTYEIRIDLTGTQTSIEQGEYYWELRRTDLDAPYLTGLAYFDYDAPQ